MAENTQNNERPKVPVVSADRIEPYTRQPLYDYDRYFFVFILISLLVHILFVISVKRVDTSKIKEKTIEEVPQRIARLIMNKPKQPEVVKKIKVQTAAKAAEKAPAAEAVAGVSRGSGTATGPVSKERRAAQVNVARKATRIENELRTTGMLAMLTGQGPSRYRGRGAVDVMGGQSAKAVDLDAALKGVTGVTRAGSEAELSKQLTTRRVVETEQKVSISDMVQGFGRTEKTLNKLGDIQVSKPKTIGTAPTSANRDENIISNFVKKNMRSIEAEYNRLLKSDPGLNGKITVRFTILPAGNVIDVEVVESTIQDEALQQKIVRVVSNWVFPSIGEGEGNLTVNFPFVFQHN